MGNVDLMIEIFQTYCNPKNLSFPPTARFLTVYIEEAHASDEWKLINAPKGKANIAQHKSLNDRTKAAQDFCNDFHFPIEMVCDSMKDEVSRFYDAYPERVYIIEKGIVVYKGGLGPFDYKLTEVRDWLSSRFGDRRSK